MATVTALRTDERYITWTYTHVLKYIFEHPKGQVHELETGQKRAQATYFPFF